MSNSEIRIEDLLEKIGIEDDNLIIVEDEEDTKKSYILELKKAFSGDYYDPELYRFYSSSKVMELMNSLNIKISSFAYQKDLNELREILTNIITSNPDGTKDNEIIEARGYADSLSDRFDLEREISDDKYMKAIQRNDSFSGYSYTIDGAHEGFVEYSVMHNGTTRSSSGNIIGYAISKNFFMDALYDSSVVKDADNHGFIYTQSGTGLLITLNQFNTLSHDNQSVYSVSQYMSTGTYYLYANVVFSGNFIDKTVNLILSYSDGSSDTFEYNHEQIFQFTAKKPFSKIDIQYNEENMVAGESVTYSDVMLSTVGTLDEYVECVTVEILSGDIVSRSTDSGVETLSDTVEITSDTGVIYNRDYIFINSFTTESATIQLTYYDHVYTTNYIVDQLDSINTQLEDHIDYCGLLTEKGTYQFFNNYTITSVPASVTLSQEDEEYKRNGEYSVKLTINNDATSNPAIKQVLDNTIDNTESVTLCFYIDKTVYSNFTDVDGIRVHISSDDANISIVNYYTYIIKKSEMVQGWNFVKHNLTEFTSTGNPNSRSIKTVTVEIGRNDNLNGMSLYLNSVIFNQKMKPTVMLTFDGTYDDSITYAYPYLIARNIPVSLLLSSARTLTAEAFDYLIGLRVKYGWDIGMYGCNPNREILTQDDNYRNQYISLRNSKTWVQDNMIENPISYSAPYGNLRPITVPLLRDLGFKIARTEGSGYTANFSDKDFAISVQLISNLTTIDDLKNSIDYIIKNNLALCLYTRDITEYGSEADSTQLMFESVVNYIIEKVNTGDLQCLTMSEFYHRCTGK